MNNQIVHVMYWGSQDDTEILGVYSTRELAAVNADRASRFYNYGDIYVDEFVLDEGYRVDE